MVRCPFFIPRRKTPPLLEPIDQPLHAVPFAVDRAGERPGAPFVGLPRDREPDAAPPQVRPDLPAAVALVAHQPLGPPSWTPTPWPFDRPLLHQLLKGRRLMALAGREHEGYRLAGALTTQMDLGAEPALAAPEGFGFWVPFFAPAACWWARMTVAST
jgi:hypothetical protein